MEEALEIVIPETDTAVTVRVLETVIAVTGAGSRITLLSVRVVPFPDPVVRCDSVQEQFAGRVQKYATAVPARFRARLVFTRDVDTVWKQIPGNALVLIGTRKRWWRTREEKLARHLERLGIRTAVIEVG